MEEDIHGKLAGKLTTGTKMTTTQQHQQKPEVTPDLIDEILGRLGALEKDKKPSGKPNQQRPFDWQAPQMIWELFEVKDFFEAQICETCGRTTRVFGSRTLGYRSRFGRSNPTKWVKLAPHERKEVDLATMQYSTETFDNPVPICHHCSRTVEASQLLTDALDPQGKNGELF